MSSQDIIMLVSKFEITFIRIVVCHISDSRLDSISSLLSLQSKVWRFEGRLGGIVYFQGPGIGMAPLRGGNPPLYLPPEIMNDPSYVTATEYGLHTIKMPVDTSDDTFFEFIEPIVAPGGVTGENSQWNGQWSP